MRLFIVRHGETPWNVEGRLQGQRDIAMNGRGRDQADAAGRVLARVMTDAAAAHYVSSPLGRTRETMERLRTAMGLDPAGYALDDRLKEITFGRWEGLTWPELAQRDPDGASGREADKWGFVPPGGESYHMLTERLQPWLDGLTGDTVAVTHGGVARALMAMIGGMDRAEAPLTVVRQGEVMLFESNSWRWL